MQMTGRLSKGSLWRKRAVGAWGAAVRMAGQQGEMKPGSVDPGLISVSANAPILRKRPLRYEVVTCKTRIT
jgi:hypothetical protein